MATAIVTGCAGFIGSHVAERLVAEGYEVIGVDALTDYYSRDVKLKNLAGLLDHERFKFIEADLLAMDLPRLLRPADYVFHQAGQPGVRPSWRQNFELYLNNNVLVTQRLLEAAIDSNIKRFVYASSSSIYGDAEALPTSEDVIPKPVSPYVRRSWPASICAICIGKTSGFPQLHCGISRFTVPGRGRIWLSTSSYAP